MKQKWYAIKRPDGTWIIGEPGRRRIEAWLMAEGQDTNLANIMDDCHTHRTAIGHAIRAGYRCVEVEVVKAGGRVCEWTEDTEGTFVTSCGNYFQFTADGPKENKFQFCPYCGGKIKEAGK